MVQFALHFSDLIFKLSTPQNIFTYCSMEIERQQNTYGLRLIYTNSARKYFQFSATTMTKLKRFKIQLKFLALHEIILIGMETKWGFKACQCQILHNYSDALDFSIFSVVNTFCLFGTISISFIICRR